jgi:hypothetical protein
MNIYNFKLEIFNVCMFIIISLWFDIFHMLFAIWLYNDGEDEIINEYIKSTVNQFINIIFDNGVMVYCH